MTRRSWSLRAWGALTALLFVAIVVLPVACAVWNSLRDDSGFTLRAYRHVLTQPRQWDLLRNSLAVAVGAAACATVLGVGAAFALEYLRVPTRRILVYGLALPFLIPGYVSAVAWLDILGSNGLLRSALMKLLGTDVLLPRISSRAGVVFVYSLSYFPIVALTAGLAFRRLDRRLLEAARLSASRARAVRAVAFPLLAPSILAGTLIVFLLALVGFAVPSLLQVNVYPVEVFTSFSAFYDFPVATAQALPLIACGVAVLLVGKWYAGPRRAWLTGAARVYAFPRGGPALRIAGALACWALVLVSGALPLGVLVWRSLPLRSYPEVLSTAREEILTSLLLSAACATLITTLALSLAYLRRNRTGLPGRWPLPWLLHPSWSLAPFLISGPVIGIALIITWNRPGLPALIYDSFLIMVFACVARFLFFAYRGCDAALADLHAGLEEAAFVAGVPWWRRVSGILLPLLWPVAAGIWGLSFVLCIGELDATALVCPPGWTPLPVRVFSLMHYGPSRLVAALSVVTVIVILGCAGITAALYAQGKRIRHARR